jgi:hypothetical protein
MTLTKGRYGEEKRRAQSEKLTEQLLKGTQITPVPLNPFVNHVVYWLNFHNFPFSSFPVER